MLTRWVTLSSILAVSMPALADPYSYEVDAGYLDSDGVFEDSEQVSIHGTYYFNPVAAGHAPLRETAFADRASSLSFGAARTSVSIPTVFAGSPSLVSPPPNVTFVPARPVLPSFSVAIPPAADSDDYRAALRYVSESGWLAEAALSATESDSNSPAFGFDADGNSYSAAFGKYVGPTTTVTLGYRREETAAGNERTIGFCFALSCPPQATLSTQLDESEDTWSVRARHLLRTGFRHHAFEAGISYATRSMDAQSSTTGVAPITLAPNLSDKTYVRESSLSYAFYPLTNLSFGLSYRHADGEQYKSDGRSFFVEWFATESVALNLRRLVDDRELLPGNLGEIDSWQFGVTGRF